jgi:hypothetical protein
MDGELLLTFTFLVRQFVQAIEVRLLLSYMMSVVISYSKRFVASN